MFTSSEITLKYIIWTWSEIILTWSVFHLFTLSHTIKQKPGFDGWLLLTYAKLWLIWCFRPQRSSQLFHHGSELDQPQSIPETKVWIRSFSICPFQRDPSVGISICPLFQESYGEYLLVQDRRRSWLNYSINTIQSTPQHFHIDTKHDNLENV